MFEPVPPLRSHSNVDVRSSTPPSRRYYEGPPLSSSIQLSREGISCEHGGTGDNYDLSGAAADSTLQREESSDSGGVFLTPTSASCAGLTVDSDSSTVFKTSDLPASSLVSVGRRFSGLRLSDNGDVEYHRRYSATGFVSQNISPGGLWRVADEQCAEDKSNAVEVISSLGVPHHRSDEPFVAPSSTKKKAKKSRRRSSQPASANCFSAKSMLVYGGNQKWIWKS